MYYIQKESKNMLNGVITSTYLHDGSTNPPAPSDKYVEEGIKSTYLHKGSTSATPSDKYVE